MQQIGRYEIIAELGRGAMGSVYKARDPLIGRLVALKTISKGIVAQANSLERFYQEARSAGALQHPNIVTIYELGHESDTPFIAMEYIEGASLDQLIEQRRVLPLSVKLGYMVGLCEALSYAHRHQVVHRDVKPANIMVTKEGQIKVVDFGIARLTDTSLTQPNMMIGSRAYMSPQLYKGERADARADIWAVGVTLFELIAYLRPFVADNEAELMFRILSDAPPALRSLVPECPQELSDIVRKMLEKNTQDRYQSMEEVSRDLEPLWKSAQAATVAGLLADSNQLIAASDLQRAQGLLRKALQIDSSNSQAKSLLEKVTAELRRSQVLPRVTEHLQRGRGFLEAGRLREARAEVEAALGLDSRYEPVQKLLAELEAAAARAQEVEQKLRLTKQRLAEGALTEAAVALASALDLDSANPQAHELRRQIDEESKRRQRRKKLSELLHQARTLWTALNYEECLTVLAAGLEEFPNEPELTKLRDMARNDLEDLNRQRQMGDVRKLLGQQKFAEAGKIAELLVRKYPQDPTIKNLQTSAREGEQEEKKRKRLVEEIAGLRTLLTGGKYSDAVVKGNALLSEYPEEFELKELVAYARAEQTQLEQSQREKEIRRLIEHEQYQQAETAARKATRDFPKLEVFLDLAEEARQKRQEQERRQRAREELAQRIEDVRRKLGQEKISDAITLAQQTMATFGPDPDLTLLLDNANEKQLKKAQKEDQEKKLAAAKTMADKGKFAAATQILNDAIATRIFEPSDPRIQQRLVEIEKLSSASETGTTAPPAQGAKSGHAAGTPSRPLFSRAPEAPAPARGEQAREPHRALAAGAGGTFEKVKGYVFSAIAQATARFRQKGTIPRRLPKPIILGVAAMAIVVSVGALFFAATRNTAKKETELRERAIQQWSSHELDGSEQTWREIQNLRGRYQKEAAQQLADIEEKRRAESRRFQEGETLLSDQKDYAGAAQAFQEVAQMNLWLADKARTELERARSFDGAKTLGEQEQLYFAQGQKFFDDKAYDNARKEFLAAKNLNVPDSALRPQIDIYLKRIAQSVNAQKLYELATAYIKNEDWSGAQEQFQEMLRRKEPLSGEARRQMEEVTQVLKLEESFAQAAQGGNSAAARNILAGMQRWPKTQTRLGQELASAERQQVSSLEARARALEEKTDYSGMERLLTEIRGFKQRAGDPSSLRSMDDLDKRLTAVLQGAKAREDEGAAWDAAIKDFYDAKQKRDIEGLKKRVIPEFQVFASGNGRYRDHSKQYLDKIIPAAIDDVALTLSGKIAVPAINCGGGQRAPSLGDANQAVSCDQLDRDPPLQWQGLPVVEYPEPAKRAGKLPYTLHIVVKVDSAGSVKIDKAGNVDKDFFNKAKDAAKHWKTTVPRSGGKAVGVSFPLEIVFP